MKTTIKLSWLLLILLSVTLVNSCKKDSKEATVISSFTFAVDATDFMKVAFTSEAQNFKTLAWDFGDGSAISTETNPVHTYTAVGTYTVKLTATSPGGATDMYSTTVTISDPNAFLTKLVGEGAAGKTWKLIRDVSTGVYPLQCGPFDHSTIWWAVGKDNDELAKRPCMLNDEWTFKRDGSFTFDAKGDFWAEGNIFAAPTNVCTPTTTMIGANGEDLSGWGNGTHNFRLVNGTTPKLVAKGKGAFVGFFKLGNGKEVNVPAPAVVMPDSIVYNVVSLVDGTVDTLIVEGQYQWDATPGGYWRFVLVHYDNPADEPPIPGNKPSAGFNITLNGRTATFENTTTGADSYLWDFGDGQTSTAMAPTHTYATDGIYNILLTATNTNGNATATTVAFVTTAVLTDALLQGGAWKVRVEEKSIFVGSGLGKSDWWSLPKSNMTTGTGADNWTCITDDEFTFKAGGVFTYDTKGSARNDGYFGGTNGCIDDAGIAASGNGAAFGSCNTHSYVFTPGGKGIKSYPTITLTNGAGHAAFLGFYKGYYGGENTDGTKLPNGGNTTNVYSVIGYANTGTKEYLFVSVDLSPTHVGTSAWSAILER